MFKFKGLEKAFKMFTKFVDQISQKINPARNRGVLNKIGEELVTISNNCFDNECAPDGSAWVPLKNSTLVRRRYIGNKSRGLSLGRSKQRGTGVGAKILFIDGTLRNSITYYIKGKSIVVGSPLKYAGVHMSGDRRRNIPARPFLGLDRSFKHKIGEIIFKTGARYR
ncbi:MULTISPECIES: phage virion morphogenesis protein [unclassified Borrelia]|uniref:phage virion morphogenesis protein n=1 Tax=unclassified Borrelia TaxID=2649934 RepID=UPI001E589101|nr:MULTISPECIES: phage virion morphogenesis protein [unclassified Borrelia]UGQ16680.1 phage virion morphogenesis protein [Borrelia sp. RT5S]UGQ17838.1 phage virion morphogenesis protein [Borrelia sp. RT1S]